jgi:glycosyltransferase involved in cell wall biosynthesis
VLYLGRLVDFKGPDVVIRAFELARRRGFGGRLIIAGDGPLRVTCELLRATSTSRDDIQMLGAVDAATGEALLQQADIFTAHNRPGPLTHQEEALGVSILEAMASGLPVISGRSGGVLETVLDGVTGILVPPGDVDAHAEAFIALGSDPERRASLGRAGWQRVAAHFSAESERVQIRQLVGLATGAS